MKDLLDTQERSVLSFNQACLKFDFLRSHPFHYLQAQSYAMQVHKALSDNDWDDILLSKLTHPSDSRGRISSFYLFLRAQIDYESRNAGITKWSVDVPGITTDSILDATQKAIKYIPNISYWEMTLRIIHRGYISPKRNHLMGGCPSPACSRCGESEASLFHCFWSCPISQSFWQRVHQFVVTHTTFRISLDPAWALFGSIQETDLYLPSHSKRLIFCISAAARKTILQMWIGPNHPSLRIFLEKLTFLLRMDWVDATLRKESRVQKFFLTWQPIIIILPDHVKTRIQSCFQNTTWYLEQIIGGNPPIPFVASS